MSAALVQQEKPGALLSRGEHINEVLSMALQGLLRGARPERVEVMRELQRFLESHQVTQGEIVTGLMTVSQGQQAGWLQYIHKFEQSREGFRVLPPVRIPESQQTASTPETYELSDSIVADAAQATTSIIILGPSRAGKSTLLRAIMAYTLHIYPDAEFRALDLQTLKLLGLQLSDEVATLPVLERGENGYPFLNHVPNTVTQVTSGEQEHMLLATEAIKEVWNVYRERSGKRQSASRTSGAETPQFHLFRFLINEWNNYYKWADTYGNGKADRAAFAAEARSRGIADPLYPLDAVQCVEYLISSGAELGLSVCLVAQEYTKESTGLAPAMQANTTIIGIGRIDPETKLGGYETVSALTTRPDRFKNVQTRRILGAVVAECIKTNTPVLISTLGQGFAGILPNYKDYEREVAIKNYRWPII